MVVVVVVVVLWWAERILNQRGTPRDRRDKKCHTQGRFLSAGAARRPRRWFRAAIASNLHSSAFPRICSTVRHGARPSAALSVPRRALRARQERLGPSGLQILERKS